MPVRGLLLAACVAVLATGPAHAQIEVPPGNRNAEQPAVPGASASRTRAARTTYDRKYEKIIALLRNDGELRSKMNAAAARFGIDPIHMAAAMVGEHTYNVDAYDRLQTYYVKAVSYLGSQFAFAHGGENIAEFVTRAEFETCARFTDSYALWSCRENVWDAEFRGRTVEGASFPDDRFGAVFFQPFYAGQTFGLGQLNPLTALKASDMVTRIAGLPALDVGDPQSVYRAIMDPDATLAYMAATIRVSIDAYADIAGFDISTNPGITATLYNIGNPRQRARVLKAENDKLRAAGQTPRLPQENYYGWLVNDRIEDLTALFSDGG